MVAYATYYVTGCTRFEELPACAINDPRLRIVDEQSLTIAGIVAILGVLAGFDSRVVRQVPDLRR